MASKKSKNNKPSKAYENREKRRMRTMQLIFVGFSIILILSMMLALASK